nr:unnamed protein product [Callosobruchus chinensis]
MQTSSNLPGLAVSGYGISHTTVPLIVHSQSVALVQMLSYHNHEDLTKRNFLK